MHTAAPLGGSPFALLCFFTFSHTPACGGTTSFLLLPFFLGHSHFLSSYFFLLHTLPFLMSLLSTLKAFYHLFYYFLPSYFSHSTLHYPTCQHSKFICHFLLSFYLSSLVPAVLGQVAELLTSPTFPSLSFFQF